MSILKRFIRYDEATSVRDNESDHYIQVSLDKLSKDRGTNIAAHRLSAIRNGDEVIVINNNGIQERGTNSYCLMGVEEYDISL